MTDPLIKDGIQKYITYNIRGEDVNGPFNIYRRFKNFVFLRETLVKRWPGCYIPALPQKKNFGIF